MRRFRTCFFSEFAHIGGLMNLGNKEAVELALDGMDLQKAGAVAIDFSTSNYNVTWIDEVGSALGADMSMNNDLATGRTIASYIYMALANRGGFQTYEEVAYFISQLENSNNYVGSGMVGFLDEPMNSDKFLSYLKEKMNLDVIRHTKLLADKVCKIAVCGGSGSFLLNNAKRVNADVYITGDFKYHEFFDAENDIVIADIGHYESEVYTKELFSELLTYKFPNIVFYLSETSTNPIVYFK